MMNNLPEELLLMVMSHLEVGDVFSCRLVCKRFARLALDPQPWQAMSLIGRSKKLNDPNRNPWFCPVLRLAPCLDLISINLPSDDVCDLLYTAPCPARRLRIDVVEDSGTAHAGLLIRHQRDLGRLRDVELLFSPEYIAVVYDDTTSRADATLLFGTLVSTPDLTRIKIGPECAKLQCAPRSLHPTVSASLKYFCCPLSWALEHFYYCMLARHAATLEEVELNYFNYNPPLESLKSPTMAAQLLSQMPHLSKLVVCRILPGMEAVAECASLRAVRLAWCVSDIDVASTQAAAAFLQRAHQLRTVHLYDAVVDVKDLGVELITALASSGRSCVESLSVERVYHKKDWTDAQLSKLLRALPRLPALRRLQVNLRKDSIAAQKLRAEAEVSSIEFN